MVYIIYMYMNKRTELAQRGIPLQKIIMYYYKSDFWLQRCRCLFQSLPADADDRFAPQNLRDGGRITGRVLIRIDAHCRLLLRGKRYLWAN